MSKWKDIKDVIPNIINPSLTISQERFLKEINEYIKESGNLPAFNIKEQDSKEKEKYSEQIFQWYFKIRNFLNNSFSLPDNKFVSRLDVNYVTSRTKENPHQIIVNLIIELWMIAKEITKEDLNIDWRNLKLINAKKNKIFIVHGHNHTYLKEFKDFLLNLGFNEDRITILYQEPNHGSPSLIEKLESYAEETIFAIVLLTKDDEGIALKDKDQEVNNKIEFRARQNVIFEMGYFMALLERKNVICFLEEGLKEPSDITGITYNALDKNGKWKDLLKKELTAAKLFSH